MSESGEPGEYSDSASVEIHSAGVYNGNDITFNGTQALDPEHQPEDYQPSRSETSFVSISRNYYNCCIVRRIIMYYCPFALLIIVLSFILKFQITKIFGNNHVLIAMSAILYLITIIVYSFHIEMRFVSGYVLFFIIFDLLILSFYGLFSKKISIIKVIFYFFVIDSCSVFVGTSIFVLYKDSQNLVSVVGCDSDISS